MNILGIASNYHDASAAIVCDGKVIASACEERFTSQKHDPSFPIHSIQFCLKQAGLTAKDLDYVVYHEDPIVKFSRTLATSFKNFPSSLGTFLRSMKEAITSGFWIKSKICLELEISPKKVCFAPHHMSHAAHAFLTSPFEEAAILTIDAVGEWSTTAFFKGSKNAQGLWSIEPLEVIPFPHSLGLVYSAFTAFLGFKANDGECSTMALAAFGRATYRDEVEKIIKIQADGGYLVDLDYFDFSTDNKIPVTKKFLDAFGSPRPFKEQLPFSSFDRGTELHCSMDSQRFADIAASLQVVLEESVLSLVKKIQLKTGAKFLCYAGGVALNCVANSKILESKLFQQVYIPPDPGDGGGAMGSALYASMLFDSANYKLKKEISPYLGESHSSQQIIEMLPHLNTENWKKFTRVKLSQSFLGPLHHLIVDSSSELVALVAKKIEQNQIVGWYQGRFENGPRALGNRSILCNASSVSTALRLSDKVKKRAYFRPYACAMTDQEAHRLLEGFEDSQLAKWMQASFKVKREFQSAIQTGLHIDFTTRAQVCGPQDNHLFFNLLTSYQKISGIGAMINTSFNEKGFPIVSSPLQALLMFARTDMDILVLNNLIISKQAL